jgi:very-short-patch-repair endonuclease
LLLWRLLRLTRGELRFRRQHPIGPDVADFYCPAAKIVIQVDGTTHDHSQDADAKRDAYMARLGLESSAFPQPKFLRALKRARTRSSASVRRELAPPPPSLAAERSPSPLLRNGEV